MGWGSSAQVGRLNVWGTKAELGAGLVGRKLAGPPVAFIAGRPRAALLFWFLVVVLLSICLLSSGIVAACIAAHILSCLMIQSQKIGKDGCWVFWFYLVILVLCMFFVVHVIVLSDGPGRNQGRVLIDRRQVKSPQYFYCWPSQGGSSVLVLWWF